MAPIVDEPEKQQIADAAPADTAGAKRKRKREKEKENKRSKAAGADAVPAVVAEPTGIAPAVRKPRIERVPEKPVKPVVETLDEAVAQMNPQLTVDYITRKLRHFEKDLSSVEMDDRLLKGALFLTFLAPTTTLAYTENRICVLGCNYLHTRPQPRKPPRIPRALRPRNAVTILP